VDPNSWVSKVKILGVDVGAGTKDVLLYDSEKTLENCVKMVLPSPTLLYAQQVSEIAKDLYLDGYTIGGGGLTSRLREHVAKGFKVFMSEEAAFSLYNRLERVKALGVEIVERLPTGFRGEHITLDEVGIGLLKQFFSSFSEPLEDVDGVAIAVQDHGVPPEDMSQNAFRLAKFQELFSRSPEVSSAVFPGEDVPLCYRRMRSAVKAVKQVLPCIRVFVMDSTIAAIAGCLLDKAEPIPESQVIAVNVGNSHITAAVTRDERVVGFMEHHTSLLNAEKLQSILERLESGTLTNNEISTGGGHGAFYLSQPSPEKGGMILVTGPQRTMMKEAGRKIRFAAPTGDVMMTGVYGLIKAVEKRTR